MVMWNFAVSHLSYLLLGRRCHQKVLRLLLAHRIIKLNRKAEQYMMRLLGQDSYSRMNLLEWKALAAFRSAMNRSRLALVILANHKAPSMVAMNPLRWRIIQVSHRVLSMVVMSHLQLRATIRPMINLLVR